MPSRRLMPRAAALVATAALGAAVLGAQSPMTVEEAAAESQRGDQFFTDARYPEAYEAYHRALEAGSPDVVTHARKGKIRSAIRLARFQIARLEAEALKASAENDPEAATMFADALWGEALFDEAEAAYQEAYKRHPQWARAEFGVARSLATHSQLNDALTVALAAYASAPKDPEVLVLLGELYERLGRFDDAAKVLEEYVVGLPRRLRGESEVASLKIRFLKAFRGRTPINIEGDPAAQHTVPFTLRERKILVAAELNGRRVDLVIDTGADRSAITRDTSLRADVRPIADAMISGAGQPGLRQLSVARADSIQIGSLTVRNVPVSIRRTNMPGTANWQNEVFSPVPLGLSVVVDYQRRELTLARRIPETPADFRLPMRLHRLAMVRGMLNDTHPAYFIVDTGGELVSISQDVMVQLDMRPVRLIPIKVFGVAGVDPSAVLLPGVNLDFDTIEMNRYGVAVLNLRAPSVLLGFKVGGILGHKFLGGYRVALDIDRAELRLQKF
jgi:tetratricopeptide (TPR) repeat protein